VDKIRLLKGKLNTKDIDRYVDFLKQQDEERCNKIPNIDHLCSTILNSFSLTKINNLNLNILKKGKE
jgi:hypothetical protein